MNFRGQSIHHKVIFINIEGRILLHKGNRLESDSYLSKWSLEIVCYNAILKVYQIAFLLKINDYCTEMTLRLAYILLAPLLS